MKVFDLRCEQGHVFEGWFSSLDNYESQESRGLIRCPVCDSHHVQRKLSAPRLNVSHLRDSDKTPVRQTEAVAAPASAQLAQFQAQMLQHVRRLIRNTENVGDRFVEEVRLMHEGEIAERAIRGTASIEERQQLAEEGIAVMPIPDFLDDERLQ